MSDKHKEYLNRMLTEAEMVDQPKSEEPSPSYKDGYEPVATPEPEIGQAEKIQSEAYLTDALLNRVWEVFAYVADETLYQYINKPEGIQTQFINYVINVNEKTLTINVTEEEKNQGVTREVLANMIKIFENVLKKRLKSSFKVTVDPMETVQMGRPDSDKIMTQVVIEIASANPEDLANPGDADYFKRVDASKATEVSNEVEVK